MLKASIHVKDLLELIFRLKQEQSEYSEAISNLKDDCEYSVETIAIQSLRTCKSIVDGKIAKLERLLIVLEDIDENVLDGVKNVRYYHDEEKNQTTENKGNWDF